MEYLYHYTSLETLALILKNKSLCFNNLLNVDDIEEAKTKDMGDFGRFVYVSCWTDDAEESIPLWNLYTPNMHGVRIRLPKFPFKKYYYKKGEYFFSENVGTYIDCETIFEENKISVPVDNPKLIKVEYTEEAEKLFPIVRMESYPGALKRYLEAKDMSELKSAEIRYSFEEIGKYKRENWKFQNEWRYKITIAPMGLQESNPPTFQKQQEYIRRIEDRNIIPPYQSIFLSMSESAFEDMEIVFGPKMSEAEKIMAIALISQYAPKCIYRESNLKIR
jgi:hypothetical protein